MKRLFFLISLTLLLIPVVGQQKVDTKVTAKAATPWLVNGILYQIYLRSFTPEGTIKAAAKILPQIADLGVTVIYLSPINLMDSDMDKKYWSKRQKLSAQNNPKNPYRIKDFRKIDPEFGTEKDLREFVAKAHELNLKILLDVVLYHTGPTCVLMKDPSFYKRDENGNIRQNLWNFLVLDYSNPELRSYMTETLAYWIKKFDIDGYRCDVSFGVPLDFWEESRLVLEKIKPDIAMLAESSHNPIEQYKAFDASYSFPWYDTMVRVMTQSAPASDLKAIWKKLQTPTDYIQLPEDSLTLFSLTPNNYFPGYIKGSRFIRCSDNHDLNRAWVVFGEKGSRAIDVLNFTIDGIPFIYNGQEIGDATPQDLFAYWPKIRWEAKTLPAQKEQINWYKKLIQMRKKEPVFVNGETIWLENDRPESVLAFKRQNASTSIISVINFSNREISVNIKLSDKNKSYANIMDDDCNKVSTTNQINISLKGFGYFVGKEF